MALNGIRSRRSLNDIEWHRSLVAHSNDKIEIAIQGEARLSLYVIQQTQSALAIQGIYARLPFFVLQSADLLNLGDELLSNLVGKLLRLSLHVDADDKIGRAHV